jgi:hypothetical protein
MTRVDGSMTTFGLQLQNLSLWADICAGVEGKDDDDGVVDPFVQFVIVALMLRPPPPLRAVASNAKRQCHCEKNMYSWKNDCGPDSSRASLVSSEVNAIVSCPRWILDTTCTRGAANSASPSCRGIKHAMNGQHRLSFVNSAFPATAPGRKRNAQHWPREHDGIFLDRAQQQPASSLGSYKLPWVRLGDREKPRALMDLDVLAVDRSAVNVRVEAVERGVSPTTTFFTPGKRASDDDLVVLLRYMQQVSPRVSSSLLY